jgi:hypothetical protein
MQSPGRADSRPAAPLPINPVAVRRVKATCRERSYEVVPSAVDADFDDVTSELLVSIRELCEPLRRINDPTVVVPQLVAVDVPDPTERVVRANWARAGNFVTDVATGPDQLGMSVAKVAGVEGPAAETGQCGPARQPVIDGRST